MQEWFLPNAHGSSVINPGAVFGPYLGTNDGQNVKMVLDMIVDQE